jgi:hypothetical protein
MLYTDILRYQPWLRFCDKYEVSSKLLSYTNGDTFLAFNNLTQSYELHSVRSFLLTSSSCNGVVPANQVNGGAFTTFRESELRKFMEEIQSDLDRTNFLYDQIPEKQRTLSLANSLKQIENALGTRI